MNNDGLFVIPGLTRNPEIVLGWQEIRKRLDDLNGLGRATPAPTKDNLVPLSTRSIVS